MNWMRMWLYLNNLKKLSESDKEKLVAMAKPYAGMIVENYKRVFS